MPFFFLEALNQDRHKNVFMDRLLGIVLREMDSVPYSLDFLLQIRWDFFGGNA